MKRFFLTTLYLSATLLAGAQYAPQAGVTGSDAVSLSSPLITRWATGCNIRRGLQHIADPSLGYAQTGDSTACTGIADGSITSLGDSGIAILTFARPIMDGPGADFAVFENGFANPQNPEEAYLELAFVEVSSDGVHYVRFPASSVTQDTLQVAGVGEYMNARRVHNLAGKYIGRYGTPFDLQELAGKPGLDINAVTHVRIVDVVGSIGAHGTLDASGLKINDPYPTPFPTGGFDLDAVGVMDHNASGITTIGQQLTVSVFPNPVTDHVSIKMAQGSTMSLRLTDATGRVLKEEVIAGPVAQWSLGGFATGMYYLSVRDENNNQWSGKVFRQ